MNKGKEICETLKEIRQQIADNNDIEYAPSECHFQGECKGTCPKCEAEVRYLENELHKRNKFKKVASIAGISLGVALTFSACTSVAGGIPPDEDDYPYEQMEDSLYDNYLKENAVPIKAIENEDKNTPPKPLKL